MKDNTHGRAVGAIGPGDVKKLADAGLTVVDTRRYDEERAAYLEKIEALTLALDAQAEAMGRLEAAARAVVEGAHELNFTEGMQLVSTAALRELGRCVSSNSVEGEPAQQEETQHAALAQRGGGAND